jgi:hypothetical protein
LYFSLLVGRQENKMTQDTDKKDLEDRLRESDKYYGPTTPEEVDERREHPSLYQEPYRYYGPTTPEEVDERREHPDLYQEPYRGYYGLPYIGPKYPDD